MVTFVLAMSHFQGSHTGRRITEKVCAAVKDVKCEDKVVSVVQDEAANAVSAVRLLMEKHCWDPLTCGAHRLQTCIHYALDANRHLQTLLARCRRLVAHFFRGAVVSVVASERKVVSSNPPTLVHTPCRSPRLAQG